MNKNLFPSLCIDNFYENPDEVRNWALSLPYDGIDNTSGKYPGKQTKFLHEISPIFFDIFCKKIFSLFFDVYQTSLEWNVTTAFSLIDPYDDEILNTGWVHTDDVAVLGGIIYLTPDAEIDSGTSIGYLNRQIENYMEAQEIRKPFYTGQLPKEKLKDYKQQLIENNNAFVETVKFNNVYNRMICFDGQTYHKANSFGKNIPRLTQVFFVNNISSNSEPPIQRMRNFRPFLV